MQAQQRRQTSHFHQGNDKGSEVNNQQQHIGQ